MRFAHTASYDAGPDDVYAMLTDPVFREKVCVAVRAVDHQVTVEGTTVTIDQTQRVRKVPAFAAKLVGETITMHQVERWASPTAAKLRADHPRQARPAARRHRPPARRHGHDVHGRR